MEGESQLDGNLPTAASGKSSSTGNNSCRVILVKSAKEENFSFASCNNIASSAQTEPKPNRLEALKIQKTTTTHTQAMHEKVEVVKKKKDVEKLECSPIPLLWPELVKSARNFLKSLTTRNLWSLWRRKMNINLKTKSKWNDLNKNILREGQGEYPNRDEKYRQ